MKINSNLIVKRIKKIHPIDVMYVIMHIILYGGVLIIACKGAAFYVLLFN